MGANQSSSESDIMQGQTFPSQPIKRLNSASEFFKGAASNIFNTIQNATPFTRVQAEESLCTDDNLQHKLRELETYRFPPNEVLSEYKFPSNY
jgi:hypothetical protein